MKLTTTQVDYANIGLIIISLGLAYLLPFRLFLFSYAVLGPLHYLTEINWLEGRKYFVNTKKIIWIFAAFAIVFALPFLMELPVFGSTENTETFQSTRTFLRNHINALVFIAFGISIALVMTHNRVQRYTIILIFFILSILLNNSSNYNLLIGLFVPTVIHVYLFTLLFMFYGALKAKSKAGLAAAFFALLVPFIIIFTDLDAALYVFSDQVKETFIQSDFHSLVARLAGMFGTSDGRQFYFYESAFLKLQVFIAFAYTYHYLNWFSKTSVIGWAQNLNKKRAFIIVSVWILSVAVYWFDYRTGFLILLALSLLHVLAEFPLNVVTIKGIISEIKRN